MPLTLRNCLPRSFGRWLFVGVNPLLVIGHLFCERAKKGVVTINRLSLAFRMIVDVGTGAGAVVEFSSRISRKVLWRRSGADHIAVRKIAALNEKASAPENAQPNLSNHAFRLKRHGWSNRR